MLSRLSGLSAWDEQQQQQASCLSIPAKGRWQGAVVLLPFPATMLGRRALTSMLRRRWEEKHLYLAGAGPKRGSAVTGQLFRGAPTGIRDIHVATPQRRRRRANQPQHAVVPTSSGASTASRPSYAGCCPLCGATAARWYYTKLARAFTQDDSGAPVPWQYWQCRECSLVFADPSNRLDVASEMDRYGLHQNEFGQEGYRRFLTGFVDAVLPHVTALHAPARYCEAETSLGPAPRPRALDFGCGPGDRCLTALLRERGFGVVAHDPLFFPNPHAVDGNACAGHYDLITATEVIEHMHRPGRDLAFLWGLLAPGGALAVMTSFLPPDPAAFATWHYHRDPTHVSFFSRRALECVAEAAGAERVTFPDGHVNVAILHKGDVDAF